MLKNFTLKLFWLLAIVKISKQVHNVALWLELNLLSRNLYVDIQDNIKLQYNKDVIKAQSISNFFINYVLIYI